ncbi:DUF2829 domain-containing protein [[Eubacterium] cellulosolvens]
MTFSEALELIKDGFRLTRMGWNGPNQYVTLQRPDEHSKMTEPYIYIVNAQGGVVPWLASQGDLMATDWDVVG